MMCIAKIELEFYLWFDELCFTLIWPSWLTGHQLLSVLTSAETELVYSTNKGVSQLLKNVAWKQQQKHKLYMVW